MRVSFVAKVFRCHALSVNIALPYWLAMELKTARLTLLIDPHKKAAFERLCAQQDRTPSQVVRQLIRDYLSQHEVGYVGSGAAAESAESTGRKARLPPEPAARRSSRSAPTATKRKRA